MSSSDVCVTCQEPLLLEIDSDSDVEEGSSSQSFAPTAVPDDLEFPCSCHFHWYETTRSQVLQIADILLA
jgi:hypothetical protein